MATTYHFPGSPSSGSSQEAIEVEDDKTGTHEYAAVAFHRTYPGRVRQIFSGYDGRDSWETVR
jgi:hypothetical protein